jgi:hypothetical protein
MWRILTASLGAGTVSGHRMIDVIPGGDQRPGQQDVSVPGQRRGAAAVSAGSAGVLPGAIPQARHGFASGSASAAPA